MGLGFPAVTALDVILARFLLNFMLNTIVFSVIVAGIIYFYDLNVIVDYKLAVASLVLSGMLGLGVGTFNCVLFIAFPTYANIWSILTRPLFLLSGVLFLIEDLSSQYRDYLFWNPVAHNVAPGGCRPCLLP